MGYTLYSIEDTVSGGVYVGQTRQAVKHRWGSHIDQLRNHRHANAQLQHDWDTDGAAAFVFRVLGDFDDQPTLDQAETATIAAYRTIPGRQVYNLTDGGRGAAGRVVTAETRHRLSAAARRRLATPKGRSAMLAALARAAVANRVRLADPAERARIGERARAAHAAHPDMRDAVAAKNRARYSDPAARAAHAARLGEPTTKARMQAASKQRWADADARAAVAAAVRQRFADPAERAAQAERIRAANAAQRATPEGQARWEEAQAKRRARMRQYYIDHPEAREQRAAETRAHRAAKKAT